jgi:DNA repair protein RecO (recombination protein O)
MHTMRVQVEDTPGHDLAILREATIESPRLHLTTDLRRMEAAGKALSWVRRAAAPRTPEPHVWEVVVELLDRLDHPDGSKPPTLHLAECGLRLLVAFGWGLDFERCVVTGAICAPGRAAMIDPERGGLVSRAAGGARIRLPGAMRERLLRASAGRQPELDQADVEVAISLVESALRAHAGLE